MIKQCGQCRCEFKTPSSQRKFCSMGCYRISQKLNPNSGTFKKGHRSTHHSYNSGSHHQMWRGGRTKRKDGYILVWVAPRTRVLEHRYVMEQHLGRKLARNEHVHHINHDRSDNRIDNLKLMSTHEHNRLHATEQWRKDGSLSKRDKFGRYISSH